MFTKITIIYKKKFKLKKVMTNSSCIHEYSCYKRSKDPPCRIGSVGSVPASLTVGREFASRPGHTKDHHKNGTNCLHA